MDISRSLEIIKSISDTSRLTILNALIDKPQYVEELANRLNLAVSTVSFHLKKLEKAGLINKTKEQYYVIYNVNDSVFDLTLRDLVKIENVGKYVQEERMKKYRDKVLNTFFKKNKLVKLPVQHKKRLIILEEFLKKFEIDKKYEEEEVNKIINKSFDDHCTIRRLLIEEGYMRRKNQTYWLLNNSGEH